MTRSSNMVIPEVVFMDGIRIFQEKVDVFNEASRGTIVLEYDREFLEKNGGDFQKPVKFARPSSLDLHVDEANPTNSDTAATFSQAKGAWVHQARRAYGAWTRDEVKRGLANTAEWTNAIATFIAEYKLYAIRENLLASGVAAVQAMDTPSANYHILDNTSGTATGAKSNVTFGKINTLLNKMGDAREKIETLVMHSSVFGDLVVDGLDNYVVDSIAGAMIIRDVVQLFGRNIMVIDSPSLYTELTSDYYTQYYVLGLAKDALTATVISEDVPDQDTITDLLVKKWTLRQDYDVQFAVQAMKWIVANALNPTDAELATAANWDEDLSDHREMGIVMGVFNASTG